MRKTTCILFFFLLSACFLHSCSDDYFDESAGKETIEAERLLNEARKWYEVNGSADGTEVSALRLAAGETELLVKPDWKHYAVHRDTAYDVVEVELYTRQRLAVIDGDAGEKLKETGDARYSASTFRLMIQKDLKTERTSGYYINIQPEAQYLESIDFKYGKMMSGLQMDTAFCGRVVRYDMEGNFMNGKRYRQGRVVASMTPLPRDMAEYMKSNPATRGGTSEDCYLYTDWTVYDLYKPGAWIGYGGGEIYVWDYQYTEIMYDVWYECDEPVGGGDGNNDGSGPPPPLPGNNDIFKNNSLDDEQKRILKQKMDEMLEMCGYSTMYNYLMANNYKLNDIRINPSLHVGGYMPGSKEIAFRDNEAISSGIQEEFIHFFQDMYYPDGIDQYGKGSEGGANIEFEAKLLQDILCSLGNGYCPEYGSIGSKYSQEYSKWIIEITDGGMKMPDYDDLLVRDSDWGSLNYWDFMEGYTHGDSGYTSPIDGTIEPLALKYIKENGCY